MDLEAQQHLKDCLFHGVCKHICDSVWYLYRTPGTSYSQLMVATRRATVTTNLGEGMAKLGQQIAKLMATLMQTRHGSSHPSAPSSLWEHGHRWG